MGQAHFVTVSALALAFSACVAPTDQDGFGPMDKVDPNELHAQAGDLVLYEVQARSANACHPDVGAQWQRDACREKVAPTIEYRAEGMSCGDLDNLERIRLGTLDDMLEDTADYRAGITVRYIDERVGANAVWLMPLFPNNDQWNIPDACDNLGSPYAVRDYMHARGTLDRWCIGAGRDEHSDDPCWGNGSLERVIGAAHARGMKVILDVAVNHFGHNYHIYDYADFTPTRERIARGESLDTLWDYERTEEGWLLHPEILDEPEELEALAEGDAYHRESLAKLREHCPELEGDALVRGYNAWRVALDHERDQFPCTGNLEADVPGFYVGSNHWDPSEHLGDNFSNEWRDVKFLFHQGTNAAHQHEFVRQREYVFRILNYWVSRGVDGFRLDHTTDPHSGMSANEWKYIISKVDYYAYRRGQERPVFLAEEFHDQIEMSNVVDIMTEGYVGDLTGRSDYEKTSQDVERVLSNAERFGGRTFVMTALETHDEHRLTDGTGFNIWTGAGYWGIGATTWSTPMIVMGQEFGEPWGLGFRRSDFLRGRFEGSGNYNWQGDGLVDYYGALTRGRLAHENRALRAQNYKFLRSRWSNAPDPRIFAQAKWSDDGNVVFVFHNLWEQDVEQAYFIPPEIVSAMHLDGASRYRLYDILSERVILPCRTGDDFAWEIYVNMDAGTRAQWLRLELCE